MEDGAPLLGEMDGRQAPDRKFYAVLTGAHASFTNDFAAHLSRVILKAPPFLFFVAWRSSVIGPNVFLFSAKKNTRHLDAFQSCKNMF